MKIAIPVDENTIDTEVCMSFGRAPYFYIYDTQEKQGDFLANEAATAQGGAGIKAAQIIVDTGANVLITPRCGENAADVFKQAEIKLYKNKNESIEDNVKAYQGGSLEELTNIHPGFHGHGGN
ncbi:NifB/NifX family molybdenum-iron cluster-binding protein [Eubacteriaceae bacterium ES3]|nr:NifB/NifX family molybdenum-iron cluster-binding protein [Eubacteriaceae bacterium ES3]